MMFDFKNGESFPEKEEKILAFWKERGIFQKSLEATKSGPLFSFYDGPPFATGLPHYGHLLAGTIKDVVLRHRTMKGFYVPRRFGWDCHGLPIENEIEKAQKLSGALAIEEFGIANFNEECRKIVLRYTSQWEETVHRMGRWIDFSQTYRTMDLSFMESVWWVFASLYEKGLVYEGFKVMPFSAKLGTPLSNFEANLNYKDVDDPSLTVLFSLLEEPGVSLLAWTTTPWTLPSNLGLAVNPHLNYVKIKERSTGSLYILSQGRLEANFKQDSYDIVQTMKGSELSGKTYIPLFPYFKGLQEKNAFRILADEFVSIEDGTGVVHLAPAFGEVDFAVCSKAGIDPVCPIDINGHFTNEIPDFSGLFVKDADKEIIRHLKNQKRVFNHTQIRHRYPFCWRSDTPLIYRTVRTWFVAVEKVKDKLLEVNKQISWVPSHIQDGRFGKWLENARDWAISRNRYWGTPIPIWRSEDGDLIVISNVADLEKRVGKKITDLHRHHIDELSFVENQKVYKRIPEVFDCWFESGSMPYAQNHYPFENKKEAMDAFPADFIGEGLDQTRGWFYTLTVLSAALFEKPAFKNVIVNGIVLAEDGMKMSKRLKNYPEPGHMINTSGADAIRLYLLASPAVHADDIRFSAKGVELTTRQALIPLWNSYVFLSTYAKIYKWEPTSDRKLPSAEIDRWILSLLQKLILDVEKGMEDYALDDAVNPFVAFIDELTNWYIRRNRSRFWSDQESVDRNEAFETLYVVVKTLSQIAAPFIPFLSEQIYRGLALPKDPESVHLSAFPTYNPSLRDEELEKEMKNAQIVVSEGHSLRKEHKIKVRQPLSRAHIICSDEKILASLRLKSQLISDELNVKEVVFGREEGSFVQLKAVPNFRLLGKKVGPLMNAVHKAIDDFSHQELSALLSGLTVSIDISDKRIEISPSDVEVQRKVRTGLIASTSGGLTVGLDTTLTDELLLEGIARELVNKINSMRRERDLAVTDRIALQIHTSDRVKEAFEKHKEYIHNEVLAVRVEYVECQGTEWDINGERALIEFCRV